MLTLVLILFIRTEVAIDAATGIANFRSTYISNTEMDFDWDYDCAVQVMIRGKYSEYPDDIPDQDTTPSDGYLVYYGAATSTSDTTMDFDENVGPIYYKAWGQRADNTWYVSPETGWKESAVLTLLSYVALVLIISVVAFWRNNVMMFMVGVIGWFSLAFYMVNQTFPAGNDYIKYAVATFCIAMTLVMAVQVYLSLKPDTERPLTYAQKKDQNLRRIRELTTKKRRPWYEM